MKSWTLHVFFLTLICFFGGFSGCSDDDGDDTSSSSQDGGVNQDPSSTMGKDSFATEDGGVISESGVTQEGGIPVTDNGLQGNDSGIGIPGAQPPGGTNPDAPPDLYQKYECTKFDSPTKKDPCLKSLCDMATRYTFDKNWRCAKWIGSEEDCKKVIECHQTYIACVEKACPDLQKRDACKKDFQTCVPGSPTWP